MTTVAIDRELADKLLSNGGKVLLTDLNGKTLGYFTAVDRTNNWMYQEPTAEEVHRALSNPKRHTTEDVLKLLEE